MNVYLASLLGFLVVILMMVVVVKVADKFKEKAPEKGTGSNNRKHRRHK